MNHQSWSELFPALQHLPDVVEALAGKCAIIELAAGARIFGPDQTPQNFILLIEGSVRVQQMSEDGREIVPYRIAGGESCALTTACLMSDESYQAEAIAETNIRAVGIPRGLFDELVAKSPGFRRFVFSAFRARMTDLFRVIDEIAFSRMDVRLAHKLVELSHGAAILAITQQQLASEIGTAREVVSRMLSEFHRRGLVLPVRGSITITNRPALELLAHRH
jgi:CRP/FNR family transcriptional regulator, anaerobic regulatory protein